MKLDIEKAAREHFAKEVKDPKRDLDYLTHCNYDFTAGANYALEQIEAGNVQGLELFGLSLREIKKKLEDKAALEQLSKSEGFREFSVPIFDPASHHNGINDVIIEKVKCIDIQALAAANAKNAALELELRKAKVESEMLRGQRNEIVFMYLAPATGISNSVQGQTIQLMEVEIKEKLKGLK